MRSTRVGSGILAGALAAALLAPGARASEAAPADHVPWLDARMEWMRPEAEAWQEIAWVTSLADARQRSAAEARPIFLWAMNGNPLGCT